MRFIAAALVVLAGAFIWGAGAIAGSLGGNRFFGETATWGGIGVVAIGLAILYLAHQSGSRD